MRFWLPGLALVIIERQVMMLAYCTFIYALLCVTLHDIASRMLPALH